MDTIQEYDGRLEQDIKSLEDYIQLDEDMGKEFMRDMGAPEKTIAEVASSQRRMGKRIFENPFSLQADVLLKLLNQLRGTLHEFDFRLSAVSLLSGNPLHIAVPTDLSIFVETEAGSFWLNTSVLSNEDCREYVKRIATLMFLYDFVRGPHGVFPRYPTVKMMRFTDRTMRAYGRDNVLSQRPVHNEKASSLLAEYTSSEEWRAEIERLSRHGLSTDKGMATHIRREKKKTRRLVSQKGAAIRTRRSREPRGINLVCKRILLVPVFGIAFAVLVAIPGALIGLITGLFDVHHIAAIVVGVLFFLTYPRSRRRYGAELDALTYFLALCGAAGGGLAVYFTGTLTA